MAMITGVRSMVRASKTDPVDVGDYTCFEEQRAEFKKTAVPCPYCRGRMHTLSDRAFREMSRIGRVVAILGPVEADGRQPVLIEAVPRGFRVVSCFPCKAHFTTPLARLKAAA